MRYAALVVVALAASVAFSAVACGDDEPGDSAEELCCSCLEQNSCGDASFDFATCVYDGYRGSTPMAIDQTCLANNCADDCDGSNFN